MKVHLMKPHRITIVLAAGLICAAVALAQSTTAPTTQPDKPAKPKKDEGWVSGIVLSVEGKPMVAMEVRAERTEPMSMGGGGPRNRRPKEVKTTTDDFGAFLFMDLEPNKEYILVGGSNEIGWVYQPVNIEAGKEVQLGEIKMVKLD
jgi:hypothetical protein